VCGEWDRLAVAWEEAVSVASSRWATPVTPGAARVRTVGWWGMMLGIVAMVKFHITVGAAYLYVRWGHTEWPPAGFERPGLTPLLILVLPIAALALLSWARAGAREGSAGRLLPAVTGAAAIGLVAVVLRSLTYVNAPFGWDEHAYASLFWLLGGYEIIILTVGVLFAAVVVVQVLLGVVNDRDYDVLEVTTVYWWFAVITSAISLTTLYLGALL